MTSSPPDTLPLTDYLERQRRRVDARLEHIVPAELEPPAVIHRAMRYSLFAGGKRIRPILCMAASHLFNQELTADMESTACTLELVHTYSLIHDDLPALDNDDFRRGKPTCHKVFGDAIAILAGDALLTLSFQVLASLSATPSETRSALVAELAAAAGTVNGMIGGQVADLEFTNGAVSSQTLEYIHRAKTAALFRASLCMGAIAACATSEETALLCEFGLKAGLAFQIADDILDVEGSSAALGKTAGKDALQKKLTYPAVHGMERSRELSFQYVADAKEALRPFGERASLLRQLADFLVFRQA